jgi:hypothetical protein
MPDRIRNMSWLLTTAYQAQQIGLTLVREH